MTIGSQPLVVAEHVWKTYALDAGDVHALRDVSLAINEGEYLSIMGPSGSGKSTFFNMIGALDRPSRGSVLIHGIRLTELNQRQLAWVRCNNIGYIFQTFNLIPSMTALENVSVAHVFATGDAAKAVKQAAETLERVGLGHRLHHLPSELSGGQQQRVAIARALVNRPRIVLADEPTGNLDLQTGKEIIDLLRTMKTELGITIISATHDGKMLSASDRVVWIQDGAIVRVADRDALEIEVGTIDGHDT
jgi:putative ABC transport system ATP-binding protein